MSRVALSLVLVGLFYADSGESRTAAFAVVCAIWLSDIADGRVARRSRTPVRMDGAVLDPVADDVAYAAGFLCLMEAELLPLWFVALAIGGRAMIQAVRLMTLAQGLPYPGPTVANRVKGAGYALGQAILFGYLALGTDTPVLREPVMVPAIVGSMTVLTVVALVDFIVLRNRHVVRRLFTP